MLDGTNGDTEVVTSETTDTSAPLEDVTNSPQQGSETQEVENPDQPAGDDSAKSEFDHLKVLDGLQLDPKTKELLKSGYLRQADYTKKTQELAGDRKLIDEYKTVRPLLEFLDKNPALFNEVVQKMQGKQQPVEGQEQVPDNPKEFAEWVKKNTIKEMLEIQSRNDDFLKAAKVDPRLDGDPEFGEMIARMVAQDPEFRAKQITAEAATAKAVRLVDGYIKKQVSAGKQDLSNKAKAKRDGSTLRSIPGTTQGKSQPKTILEAAAQAEEEMGTD